KNLTVYPAPHRSRPHAASLWTSRLPISHRSRAAGAAPPSDGGFEEIRLGGNEVASRTPARPASSKALAARRRICYNRRVGQVQGYIHGRIADTSDGS